MDREDFLSTVSLCLYAHFTHFAPYLVLVEICRKTNTPYLGTEGGFYSVLFGNRGSITIWREQRKLEI